MKKVLLTIGTLCFLASGCTSTVSLGPQANNDAVVGASLSTSETSVTLPFVKASVGAADTKTEK